MAYIDTYTREQEVALLDRLAEAQAVVARKHRHVAQARAYLRLALAERDAIKRELTVLRWGEAGLERQKRLAVAGRRTLAAQKAAVPLGETPTPLVPSPLTTSPVVLTGPPAGAATNHCDVCGSGITKRGLCNCPGKRHAAVRVILPGPKIEIKQPPVPPFDMATIKGPE